MLKFLGGVGIIALLTGSAHADVNLWIDDESGNIGLVDITTGTVSKVNNTGVDFTDIAFVGSQMFGTSFTNLYSINDNTGTPTAIAEWGFGGDGMNALVGDGANLRAASNATSTVYTATTLGAVTLQTPSPLPSAGDLAFGKNGNLYESGVDASSGNDALVDVTTGTEIDFLTAGGSSLNAVFGLATDNAGVTYAVDGTTIYTVNLSNAVLTPVLDYSGHGLGAAQGTAFIFENAPSTPEPSTWAMMLLGFAGLGFMGYRQTKRVPPPLS
jgi:hypothetical protein